MATSVPDSGGPDRRADSLLEALVIPPAGWGSLGDLAMLNGALTALRRLGFARVDVALDPPDDRSGAPFDGFVGGQQWFYKGDPASRSELFRTFDRYSDVFLIGADCLDGSYSPNSILRRIDLVGEAIRRGRRGRILGSSFKETFDERCADALRSFPTGGEILSRDAVSLRRMERVIGRPIVQAADLAFLCQPDPDNALSRPVLDWIAGQRGEGRRVVALNINAFLGRTIEDFALSHRQTVERLIRDGVSIVLAPNDVRREQNDEYFLRLVTDGLPEDAKRSLRWLPARNASATKAVLGAVDLVITSRMHAAILAAGAGRPALSYVYQGKFEGLYDLLGVDQSSLLFAPSDLIEKPVSMAERTMAALDRSESFAATINRSLPMIMDLAQRNFS